MPRLTLLLVSLVLGAGCAVLISSCGGDEGPETGIPAENADGMLGELERAQAAFAAGDCEEVAETAEQLQGAAAGALVEAGVDAEVREGINQGAAHLAELAATSPECEDQETTTTTDEEKPEPETEPTTTAPTTTTTEETTTTTEEVEPVPEEEEQEPAPPGEPPGPPGGGGGPPSGGTGDGD
jgi:hypothetical protein